MYLGNSKQSDKKIIFSISNDSAKTENTQNMAPQNKCTCNIDLNHPGYRDDSIKIIFLIISSKI